MSTIERIIPAKIHNDGSVHYSSVMSPSDDSVAVCKMVPDRVIPVIFVPGVMGTNLGSAEKSPKPVWLLDSEPAIALKWALKGPASRKTLLDPEKTTVYTLGNICVGTAQTEIELRRRGWGEVAFTSYGEWLVWLENALNDFAECKSGLRSQLIGKAIAKVPRATALSRSEVGLSYKYQFPVHAVGYNWLQSNAVSSQRLSAKIEEFIAFYLGRGQRCEMVIIVTHSMGGLVARHYSEVLGTKEGGSGHRDKVLGILHGVMPTTGSPTAYKRVKAGTEGAAGVVLGDDAEKVTAVFAQSAGPLQLLPSREYGTEWFSIRDGDEYYRLPTVEPYSEIYLQRNKWWGLIDDKLINPLDANNLTLKEDWSKYETLIKKDVLRFHKDISDRYHANTYAFYGDDEAHKTWGDIVWKRKTVRQGLWNVKTPPIPNLLDIATYSDTRKGSQIIQSKINNWPIIDDFSLQDANENGDGTVPIRSGRAPEGRGGVKVCIPYPGVDHEGAYKKNEQRIFALWAITKIVQEVVGTNLSHVK